MSRPRGGESSAALFREALGNDRFPTLQAEARRLMREALSLPTYGEAAESLGMPRSSLSRLRDEYPEIDPAND